MQLKDYIGEATAYDKKLMLERKDPTSWLKSVSAFANTQGGRLLFGVANDGSRVGLADAQSDSEFISEAIKAQMDPVPEIDLSINEEDGKRFVVVEIKSGSETPYYTFVKGHRDAFIRIGNESVKASAVELKRLVLKGVHRSWDSLPTEYRREEFSFEVLRVTYRDRTKEVLRDSDFESFGLASGGGFLTNAGALLADNSPIRHSRVFCTRWNGLTKANGIMEALDDAEFSGGLISLMNDAKRFVSVNSKRMWRKMDSGRMNYPEYPERAVEEAIVNGLIHRDYLELGSEVHIDIYDDRMEITSPGGMPSGDFVQELDWTDVASVRRNPVIADLFQRLDLTERRGSGFKKILGAYTFESEKRNAMIRPEFRSIRSAFFAVLPNLNYGRTIGQVAGQVTDQVTGQVADQLTDALTEIADSLPVNAKRLLRILETDMDSGAIMSKIRLSSRGHLRKTALNPALESGLVEMTQPNSPRSPTQKYRLTTKGRELLAYYAGIGTDGKSDGTMPICTTTKTTNKATNDPTNKTTNNPANKSSDKRSVVTLTAEALAVLREFEKDGSASADRVAKILKLTPDGVRYHIKNLRAAGRLMRVGNRRVGNWIVVNETIADVARQSAKRKGGGK
ncbi:MAG: putative DNA binding domain-containing protein [Kiritimatiellae bacterium]|nr:putative DNA binding domain-containing protein [Kiritimatiellia bacterium]